MFWGRDATGQHTKRADGHSLWKHTQDIGPLVFSDTRSKIFYSLTFHLFSQTRFNSRADCDIGTVFCRIFYTTDIQL